MVLLFHGEEDLDVADTAWGVRDYGTGKFGNWAFNVAYAGELGYNAYQGSFRIVRIRSVCDAYVPADRSDTVLY